MSISVRIFKFRMGIGIEKSDKFKFAELFHSRNRPPQIKELHNLDPNKSYKVLGNTMHKYHMIRFDLKRAVEIGTDSTFRF